MLLEIGLFKETKQNKTKSKKEKKKRKTNKTKRKDKIALSLGYPSSYFYNKRCNMLLLWLYLSFS